MKHPLVRIVVVTGGPVVVKAAMNSGKKAIARGPGQSAGRRRRDREPREGRRRDRRAARRSTTTSSASPRRRCIAVDRDRDRADRRAQAPAGAAGSIDRQVAQLEKVVLEGDHVNKNWVGKNASADREGRSASRGHGHDLRLLMCEVDEQHPFVQHELLMPVIPLVRVRDVGRGDRRRRCASSTASATPRRCTRRTSTTWRRWRASSTLDLRQERAVVRGPRLRRRGLHLVHDRVADRRGADHRAALHARAPLHAQGQRSASSDDARPALGVLEIVDDRARHRRRRRGRSSARPRCCSHSRAVSGRQAPRDVRGRRRRGRGGDGGGAARRR